MKFLRFFVLISFFIPSAPVAASERAMFVRGDNLNVRLCASSECCVEKQLKENEIVSVFEVKGAWSRISAFYDASEASCSVKSRDKVAQWVSSRYLSTTPPSGHGSEQWFGDLGDRRIRGIPRVGDYGLTRKDIEVIRRYAAQMLKSKTCSAIEAGNKSVSRPGTYYIFCTGDSGQRFFTKADLPN